MKNYLLTIVILNPKGRVLEFSHSRWEKSNEAIVEGSEKTQDLKEIGIMYTSFTVYDIAQDKTIYSL